MRLMPPLCRKYRFCRTTYRRGMMGKEFDMPRYLDALMKLAGGKPGQVIHVNVQHDEWCAHWKGGACNCDFNVEQIETDDD